MVDNTRVFNCDCLPAMREFPDKYFDLAIVDPPYGNTDAIGIQNGNSHSAKRKDYNLFENVKPNIEYFCELNRISKQTIIWGGNYFGCAGGVIVWNKYGTAFGEGELAICSTHKSLQFFNYAWNGMIQGDMKNKEERIHPTQKPVALYKWLLKNYAKEGDKILDTHGGSMSSVIACIDMGFSITCFELDEDYYKLAKLRIQNHVSQLNAFRPKYEIEFHDNTGVSVLRDQQ